MLQICKPESKPDKVGVCRKNLHWLIQTLHMLVGIGAIVLTGTLGARYMTLKRGEAQPATESQALH